MGRSHANSLAADLAVANVSLGSDAILAIVHASFATEGLCTALASTRDGLAPRGILANEEVNPLASDANRAGDFARVETLFGEFVGPLEVSPTRR